MHNILVIYSIMTWLYRLSLYIGIALLVFTCFFKVLVSFYLLLRSIILFSSLSFANFEPGWRCERKFQININTIITTSITLMLLGIFFIPFSEKVELPATMSYAHQFLFAPEEGILMTRMPTPGTHIKPTISSHKLPRLIKLHANANST